MSSSNDYISIRHQLDGAAITTYVMMMILVPLKFACRLSGGRGQLGWDDWTAAIACALANGFFWAQLIGIRPVLGHHYQDYANNLPAMITFLKYVYAEQLIYATVLPTIKASLLCLFWRLFAVRSKVPILLTAALVVCWAISTNLVLIFTCNPVESQWDVTITDAKCLNRRSVYLGASIPNVVTDVLLLVLPLPYVWNLHTSITQRVTLVSIFVLGGFVAVVSIIRLSKLMGIDLASPDVTYNLSPVFIWSSVEINVGLICACLPSLKPAVQWLGLSKLFGSTKADHNSRPSGHIEPSPYYNSDVDRSRQSKKKGGYGIFSTLAGDMDEEEDSFQMIGQHHHVHGKTDTNIDVARTSSDTERDSQRGGMTAMPAIKVQRQFNISVDRESAGRR